MAEIGVIGSIFSIAAVGASLATNLYDAADVMYHADQQIFDLAKHVLQFTAVLKHMGQVLEEEHSNCSKEVIRDIERIKRSCKRTFREIKSTLKSKRSQRFVAFRWLFKRKKALELQTRLDSHQSMLQCIIHTLTLSKLTRMNSRSTQDSGNITDMKAEIGFLKTFIMESRNNLVELKHAEQETVTEERIDSTNDVNIYPGEPNSNYSGHRAESPMRRSTSDLSVSDSDEDTAYSEDGDGNVANTTNFVDKTAGETSISKHEMSKIGTFARKSPFRSHSMNKGSVDINMHRESNALLQIIPYRPQADAAAMSNRLLTGGPLTSGVRTSAKLEATYSVRLLLDKWTTSGSKPIDDMLEEEVKVEAEKADKQNSRDFRSSPAMPPPTPRVDYEEDYLDRGFDSRQYQVPPPHENGFTPRERSRERSRSYAYPARQLDPPAEKDFWRPSDFHRPRSNDHIGEDILDQLRSGPGGISYTKSNQFRVTHFVDRNIIFDCRLVPRQLITTEETKWLTTELDFGLFRKEAIELLGYKYEFTKAGKISVSGDLELREIEDLLMLSYQALDTSCKQQSKAIIKERGWAETIASIDVLPFQPTNPESPGAQRPPIIIREPYYSVPENSRRNRRMPEYEPYVPYGSARNEVPFTPRKMQVPRVRSPSPSSSPKRHSREVTGRQEQPEVRFTLPQALPPPNISKPSQILPTKSAKPKESTTLKPSTNDELLNLRRRLEMARAKLEECVKTGNHITAADLKHYAIPDLEKLVAKQEILQRDDEINRRHMPAKDDDKSTHQAEIETESEDSDDEADVTDLYE